jgi:hypothetical protein
MSKAKFKKIDQTELINDLNKGITKQTRTYELNGEKFQIRYELSNGSPLGFNYKMCLAQYSKNDGKWNYLEDIGVLSMSKPIPSYFSNQAAAHAMEFFTKMEMRLNKIYS